MRHATILVAIFAFVPLASATAQVRPGEGVRVTHLPICPADLCVGSRRKSVGTLLSVSGDTLLLSVDGGAGRVFLPLISVTRRPSPSRSQACHGSGSRYRSLGRVRGRVGRRFDDIRGVRGLLPG